MAVNRHKNHLVVYLEDSPYREIMNGIKESPNIDEGVIDVKNPSGGWKKVFEELDDNIKIINAYEHMHVLLLIDFDNSYESRINLFKEKVDQIAPHALNRIFLMGVDRKQTEDLKAALNHQHYEKIGKDMIENCPHKEIASIWQNSHLRSL